MLKQSLGMAALSLAITGAAQAQTTIAQDDFDGNQTWLTRTFTPDNSGNTGFGGNPGTFGGSNFDVFGITNRGLLFDLADDSEVVGGPVEGTDRLGFAGIGANDPGNFVAALDTENGNNPGGFVNAVWTFDVSGYENISLSTDFVAYGDFEDSDNFVFTAQIDGGPVTTAFDIGLTAAQDAADNYYQVTNDAGNTYDQYFNPFWDNDEWVELTTNGPGSFMGSTLDYHFADNGTGGVDSFNGEFINDDGIANNGEILIDSFSGLQTVRAYNEVNSFGDFDNTNFESFNDPLFDQVSGTQLGMDLQTITSAIAGTGSTLTLTLNGFMNGSVEVFAFDNILIEGDLIGSATFIPGDFDGSGQVEQGDLTLLLNNWGAVVADGQAPEAGWVNLDDITAPAIDQDELTLLLNNWGNIAPLSDVLIDEISLATGLSTSEVTALIPEPTTAMVLALGGLGLLARRRSA